MDNEWSYSDDVLKLIFPLLDGSDLLSCMLVSHQWKDIATDDYLWKCICIRKWPSVSKCTFSPTLTYHQHFVNFSKEHPQRSLPPPRLSMEDLEFYIDLWSDQNLICSGAVSAPFLQDGIPNPPSDISEVLWDYLDDKSDSDYTVLIPIHPTLSLSLSMEVTVSVLVGRKDTNKMACIIDRSEFEHCDGVTTTSSESVFANDDMRFSPLYPFLRTISAWASLIFVKNDPTVIDVHGIEIYFDHFHLHSKIEVLSLLDMLDWK